MELGWASRWLSRTSFAFNLFKQRLGDTAHSKLVRGTDPIYKVISGAMRLLQDDGLRAGVQHHVENRELFVEYMNRLFEHVEKLNKMQIYALFNVDNPEGEFRDAVSALENLEQLIWDKADEKFRVYLVTTHWDNDVALLFQESVLYEQAQLEKEIADNIPQTFRVALFQRVDAAYRAMMSGKTMSEIELIVTENAAGLWKVFVTLSPEEKTYVSAHFLTHHPNIEFDERTSNAFTQMVKTAFMKCRKIV